LPASPEVLQCDTRWGHSSVKRRPPMFCDLHPPLRTPRRPSCRPHVEPLENRDTPSTTVLAVAPNPATLGQAVTLTATVTESGLDDLQPGMGVPQARSRSSTARPRLGR